MSIKHTNNFSTTQAAGSAGLSSGATSSTLNSTTGLTAPCYLAFDATNINGSYEVVKVLTVPGGGVVTHAALTNNHTVAEEVRCVLPAEEIDPAFTKQGEGETNTNETAIDLSTSLHQVTISANRTLTLTNETVGQTFVIRVVQGTGGSRIVTWFTTIKWAGGVAPVLTTTVGKADVFGFICTSVGNYDGFVIGMSL